MALLADGAVRIVITEDAFEAIKATLPGSVALNRRSPRASAKFG